MHGVAVVGCLSLSFGFYCCYTASIPLERITDSTFSPRTGRRLLARHRRRENNVAEASPGAVVDEAIPDLLLMTAGVTTGTATMITANLMAIAAELHEGGDVAAAANAPPSIDYFMFSLYMCHVYFWTGCSTLGVCAFLHSLISLR